MPRTFLGVAALCLVCASQVSAQPDYSRIAQLSKQIANSPNDVEIFSDRADQWVRARNYDLALKDYDRALELVEALRVAGKWTQRSAKLRSSKLNAAKAVAYLDNGDLPEAKACCDDALNQDKKNHTAWRTLSHIYLRQNNPAGALAILNQLIRNNSTDTRLWQLRARANNALGNIDSAVIDSETAIAHGSRSAEKLNDLGYLRFKNNDLPGALKVLDEAYRQDATVLEVSLNLGRVHLALNNADSAQAAFDRVLKTSPSRKTELSPSYAKIYQLQGDVSYAKPNWTDAIASYKASIGSQDNSAVQKKLAEAYSHQLRDQLLSGDSKGAIALFEESKQIIPGHATRLQIGFAQLWVEWAAAASAKTEAQLIAARERLTTSLNYHPNATVNKALVDILIRMMEHYAPQASRKKDAGLIYAAALKQSTGDRALTEKVIVKWKSLDL